MERTDEHTAAIRHTGYRLDPFQNEHTCGRQRFHRLNIPPGLRSRSRPTSDKSNESAVPGQLKHSHDRPERIQTESRESLPDKVWTQPSAIQPRLLEPQLQLDVAPERQESTAPIRAWRDVSQQHPQTTSFVREQRAR